MFNNVMKEFEVPTSDYDLIMIAIIQLYSCLVDLVPTYCCHQVCRYIARWNATLFVQIDTEKFPLGQLSKVQVAKGHAVLEVMTSSLHVKLGASLCSVMLHAAML